MVQEILRKQDLALFYASVYTSFSSYYFFLFLISLLSIMCEITTRDNTVKVAHKILLFSALVFS